MINCPFISEYIIHYKEMNEKCDTDSDDNIIDPISLDIIPPGRLISFEQLGKMFCFDIEYLSLQISKSGIYKNPVNRQPLPEIISDEIDDYINGYKVDVDELGDGFDMRRSIGDLIIEFFRNRGELEDIHKYDVLYRDEDDIPVYRSLYNFDINQPLMSILEDGSLYLYKSSIRLNIEDKIHNKLFDFSQKSHLEWIESLVGRPRHQYVPDNPTMVIFMDGDNTSSIEIEYDLTWGDLWLKYYENLYSPTEIEIDDLIVQLLYEDESVTYNRLFSMNLDQEIPRVSQITVGIASSFPFTDLGTPLNERHRYETARDYAETLELDFVLDNIEEKYHIPGEVSGNAYSIGLLIKSYNPTMDRRHFVRGVRMMRDAAGNLSDIDMSYLYDIVKSLDDSNIKDKIYLTIEEEEEEEEEEVEEVEDNSGDE